MSRRMFFRGGHRMGHAGNLVSSGPMPLDPLYVVLELGAATFFVWAAIAALRRGRLPFLELLSAATFGILLEEGDQLIFETYHYSPHFLLTVDRAPLVIGLTWALIIAGAMRITDALGVRRRYAPFVDAILAISLDLASMPSPSAWDCGPGGALVQRKAGSACRRA